MLSIENISAGYDGKLVLHNVSMKAHAGQFIGLIGPNGSGKTTLLRVISGVLAPETGQVLLQGTRLKKIGKRNLARVMACLSQDISLDLSFTVREITLMGRVPHLPKLGGESKKDFEIAENAMEFADVSHFADCLITEISGGERQRALIAMCLAQEPRVLLLDEPTNHLDIAHQLLVLDLIKKLNCQTGMTVVAVFHDLNLAAEYCDKLLVLDCGRVEAFGSPQDVLTADMILKVYGAKVQTLKNPVSNKPHIVLTADMNHSG
jgi:iron complex transport system ATP-binding protein